MNNVCNKNENYSFFLSYTLKCLWRDYQLHVLRQELEEVLATNLTRHYLNITGVDVSLHISRTQYTTYKQVFMNLQGGWPTAGSKGNIATGVWNSCSYFTLVDAELSAFSKCECIYSLGFIYTNIYNKCKNM